MYTYNELKLNDLEVTTERISQVSEKGLHVSVLFQVDCFIVCHHDKCPCSGQSDKPVEAECVIRSGHRPYVKKNKEKKLRCLVRKDGCILGNASHNSISEHCVIIR